ncbi:DUF4139 domain-containing protein [Serratia sp. DD3]|uniref:DUF4139 domain-containing protein n=1 Tax=Serratia sp. DD3 TaxID=1410619 RepID=UPI00135F1C16|nr:DUF4139 domain-containing protein [Serratia sp. DD3]
MTVKEDLEMACHGGNKIKLLMLLLLLFTSSGVWAEVQSQDVILTEATVFTRGAELVSRSQIRLAQGENEVIFTNIADGLDEKSLMVDADNGVVVQSFGIKHYFLSDIESPEMISLSRQIEAERYEQRKLAAQRQVIKMQLAVLESNRKLGSEKEDVAIEQMNPMQELVNQRSSQLLQADVELNGKIIAIDQRIEKLTDQFNDAERHYAQQNSAQFANQLVVKFYAPQAVTSNIKLSYVTNNASWEPAYDVQVESINQPVKLSYKATIFQNSGINWDNVKLTLSTINLSDRAQTPHLSPWSIELYNANSKRSLSYYEISGANSLYTRFRLPMPCNIATGGKGQVVLIKQSEVLGDYRYVVAPRIDTTAFLQVQVKNWQKLNLLPGKASIFFAGSYVGQQRIDTTDDQDTWDLSLVRDDKIMVSRKKEKHLTSKAGFWGNRIRQQYSYVTQVKNTHNEPISLVVFDQIPLSSDEAITIAGLDYGGGIYDRNSGDVHWKVNLAAGDSQQFTLGYTVNSPKDKQITGL